MPGPDRGSKAAQAKKRRAKRKPEESSDYNPKKRPRKTNGKDKPAGEPPASAAKKTAPGARKTKQARTKETQVDVEKQCGVPLGNGLLCARSLTCKTHSMGAKRAVQGRSMPYDALLAAYQKRNQVKLASLSTQQQLELDNEALMDETPLNDDEEFEQVMAGVVRAYPVPLERKVVMPTRIRTGFFRLRETLIGSITNVPPLPPMPTTASQDAQNSVNAVMASTGAVLGRTIVFDTMTRSQYARPPRVYVNPTTAMAQHQLQQKQAMLMRQQRAAAVAAQTGTGVGTPTPHGPGTLPKSGLPAGMPAAVMQQALMRQQQLQAQAEAQSLTRAG